MKDFNDFPLEIKLSFHRVIEELELRMENSKSSISTAYLESLLKYLANFPDLYEGLSDFDKLDDYKEPITVLLESLFPAALTKNEIKAASVPFHNLLFNPTARLAKILEDAGDAYELSIKNINENQFYIIGCIVILKAYYGYNIDPSKPIFYEIPAKNGLVRHYRASMNADFVSFEPTEKAVDITEKEMEELLNNVDDVSLWRKYFPPKSWVLKGVSILNFTDVTLDHAISELKTSLLYETGTNNKQVVPKFESIFRSIFNLPDLKIGFTGFDTGNKGFRKFEKDFAQSYILAEENRNDCRENMCEDSYNSLIKDKKYFIIPDVEKYAVSTDHNLLAENLLNNGMKSAILAPIAKGSKLLAVLELVSPHKKELNSVNALKLDDILPYIVNTVERSKFETENRIKAVIQSECTSIHDSVLWIFEEEAKRYIENQDAGKFAAFRDIAFDNVYPLYGQIDIVGSSDERNIAIQKDILVQLKLVDKILDKALKLQSIPIYEQVKCRVDDFIQNLKKGINASSESEVINLLKDEVDPLLKHLNTRFPELKPHIEEYKEALNPETGLVYKSRKYYDDAVQGINQKLATYIDRRQQDAQAIFPHYFERYKTDGVDHNMYIGPSMTKEYEFSEIYLYNLRLWQLHTMCEMENHFYHQQQDSKIQLDAASLILVFSNTLSIRYRMDEKKFDVDGTYNARFEIIKKRIDKAHIKGTEERVTQKGKISIIYSQDSDRMEYDRYIKYLQEKAYLGDRVEYLELEEVQGVVGLKAIRVDVLYATTVPRKESATTISYDDLIKVLE
ncbi:MAG: GAF domain-containing protein [Cytophagaceae bacterium]|nr:GAF domain-containing protein [Cytophagaceae bacterium]